MSPVGDGANDNRHRKAAVHIRIRRSGSRVAARGARAAAACADDWSPLFDGARAGVEPYLPAFRTGLQEFGFVEGQNVAIEYRFAERRYDRLVALAAELVGLRVDVIFAAGSSPVVAKAATSTIPIVFSTGTDPVKSGLVASLNRPGGNVTGIAFLANALTTKQLELLHQILPRATTVGFLVNPDGPNTELQTGNAQEAARDLGQALVVVKARTKSDFEPDFTMLVEQHSGALLVSVDTLFASERDRLAELAARHAIPSMSFMREFAAAGGLAVTAPTLPRRIVRPAAMLARF